MKKKFESAEVRVIKFEAMDIMTASPEAEEAALKELQEAIKKGIVWLDASGNVAGTGKLPTVVVAENKMNYGQLKQNISGCIDENATL